MTRDELLEKRRKAFEAACIGHAEALGFESWACCFERSIDDGSYYIDTHVQAAWWAWNAALDSVEIELPVPFEADDFHMYDGDELKAELVRTGIKVKEQK